MQRCSQCELDSVQRGATASNQSFLEFVLERIGVNMDIWDLAVRTYGNVVYHGTPDRYDCKLI